MECTRFITHSLIPQYPPDPKTFPRFYNCKEQIFTLHPGDMLFIPPMWSHWVFSYPIHDSNHDYHYNMALNYFTRSNYILGRYNQNKPFITKLNKQKHEDILNLHPSSLFINTTYHLHNYVYSSDNTLHIIDKPSKQTEIY
jgi:hypothetical protein